MKSLRIAAVLAAFMLILGGCSKGGVADVDPVQLADDLKTSLTFQDEMTAATDTVRDRLYGLESEDLEAGKVYLSTGATAEEVAVFKATSEEAAQRIYEAAQDRVESQKAAFEDYVPAEMTKLENPVLVKEGYVVVLCIVDDASAASAKVKEALD